MQKIYILTGALKPLLLEVCVPLDTLLAIAPVLFSDSSMSTFHLESAVADTEVFGRSIVELSGL
jgi:hypothetical protein